MSNPLKLASLAAAVVAMGASLAPSPALASEASAVRIVAAAPAKAVASTAAHRRHLSHLHHLHVLHLRTLAARQGASSVRARVVKAAQRYLGQPYVYGALDCSSLTQRAYAAVGKRIPRTAAGQAAAGRRVSRARPGDILVYPGADHVAMVTRVTSAGRVAMTIVARHTGTVVAYQKPYVRNYTVRAILA